MVFGAKSGGLRDLHFGRKVVAIPGQFAQRWELWTMAREATLKEIASSKLRRQTGGGLRHFYKQLARQVTVKFQSRTFKVDPLDVVTPEWGPI